jgi:hypothetical protein
MDEKFSRIIYLKNKKIIKLKESFIWVIMPWVN